MKKIEGQGESKMYLNDFNGYTSKPLHCCPFLKTYSVQNKSTVLLKICKIIMTALPVTDSNTFVTSGNNGLDFRIPTTI